MEVFFFRHISVPKEYKTSFWVNFIFIEFIGLWI